MKISLTDNYGHVHKVNVTKNFLLNFDVKQLKEIGEILKNLYGINFSDDKDILAEQIFEVIQIFPGGWSKLTHNWATYAKIISGSNDEYFKKLFNENKLPKVYLIYPLKYSIMLGEFITFVRLFFNEKNLQHAIIPEFIKLATLFNSQKIKDILKKELEIF